MHAYRWLLLLLLLLGLSIPTWAQSLPYDPTRHTLSSKRETLLDNTLVGVPVLERAVDELKLLAKVKTPSHPNGHHIAVV